MTDVNKKVIRNVYRNEIIQQKNKFVGITYCNDQEILRGLESESPKKAAIMLNSVIRKYNRDHPTEPNKTIPLIEVDHIDLYKFQPVETESKKKLTYGAERIMNTPETKTIQIENKKQSENIPATPTYHAKAKRKPFTPYGLKGYMVDQVGNIRLILDRKCNAKTIVLRPEIFSMLAEMVNATINQE